MAPLIQFKAGRSFRRGETNTVESAPGRGLVLIEEEDGLMHYKYRDLEAGSVVEDLILFPGDASFKKASERVYCLKFSSSSTREFFWFQDVDSAKDAERAAEVNRLIGAPEEEGAMEVEAPVASTSSAPAPATDATPATTAPAASAANPAFSDDSLSSMQAFLDNLAAQRGAGGAGQGPSFTLPDVLPNSILTSLLSDPASVEALLPFLPSELPPTTESLRAALLSPEFRRSTGALDRALRTGALGPLVQGLGLEQGAAVGVEAFLEGVQKQAEEGKKGEEGEGDRMEE